MALRCSFSSARKARICVHFHGSVPASAGVVFSDLFPGASRRHQLENYGKCMSRRGMMAKAAAAAAAATKGKKSGAENDRGKAAAGKAGGEDDFGLGVVPINYLKDGKHPPIKPDEDYPNWLWELPQMSKAKLSRIPEEEMTIKQMRRLLQLQNRDRIKDQNTNSRF